MTTRRILMAGAALLALGGPAAAQLAASANDNKARLVNGATVLAENPPPDTLTLLDLSARPPRVLAEIAVPASVVGPPQSVALTPDERLAIVSANQRVDPDNPRRSIPDTRLSVVDLKATPPAVVQVLESGRGPAGLSVNRAGTLALVANREEGTVGVFRIRDARLEALGKVEIGPAPVGASTAIFTPDGRNALVTRDGDSFISVLAVDGERVSRTDRVISAGIRPYGLVVSPDGRFAAVANIGRGNGDEDTVSLIDLTGPLATWRTVHTVTVGQTPEGIEVSPDGRLVAVTVMNGSNKPEGSPFRGPGLVRTYRVEGMRLLPAGEARVGTWAQGAAFSADGRTLLVGNMVERAITVLAVAPDGGLSPAGSIAVNGGSAALRTAPR